MDDDIARRIVVRESDYLKLERELAAVNSAFEALATHSERQAQWPSQLAPMAWMSAAGFVSSAPSAEYDFPLYAAPVSATAPSIGEMVNRFLAWPLPNSVCSDTCASQRGYPHRTGTNLLTADEARHMIEYLFDRRRINGFRNPERRGVVRRDKGKKE